MKAAVAEIAADGVGDLPLVVGDDRLYREKSPAPLVQGKIGIFLVRGPLPCENFLCPVFPFIKNRGLDRRSRCRLIHLCTSRCYLLGGMHSFFRRSPRATGPKADSPSGASLSGTVPSAQFGVLPCSLRPAMDKV